ncbi:hypothetical protein HNR65_002165 [Desulfosalsimonas propionicica]|uniref:Tail assembly chaperone n=1 Tax=Desulfosalsimonas propionicica TaxID=332175 RepID=A0A7W0C9U8_9BACT|nr:DUF1799 domain-containing protein [Desulfosalsimonas propionicica]MBA2881834.1 hypothetical protein [Desulfosalsimonas propionicica]
MAQNADAWELYNVAATQWRFGPNGITGLDFPAVFELAEIMEIEKSADLLRKLKALETSALDAAEAARQKRQKDTHDQNHPRHPRRRPIGKKPPR